MGDICFLWKHCYIFTFISPNIQVLVILPPTSKKLMRYIGFGLSVRPSVCASVHPCVRSSKTVHARVLKFHIWIPHGKIFDALFFFVQSYLPFLSYAPLNKIRMKSDACYILWIVHARILKFHIWIPRGNIADSYFFLSEFPPFLELCPFEEIRMKSCQQDISKSIWARGLKLGQLIGDDEWITWFNF